MADEDLRCPQCGERLDELGMAANVRIPHREAGAKPIELYTCPDCGWVGRRQEIMA